MANDIRQTLRDQLTRYQRQTSGQGDFLEEALARSRASRGDTRTAEGFIPVRQQSQSYQPQQSIAERGRAGFEAAATQAVDYPAIPEALSGMLGMASMTPEQAREFGRQGGSPTIGGIAGEGFRRGAQAWRGATPALDPWRGAVNEKTEAALQAGVPLLGILGAGAVLGGVGLEDAAIAGARALKTPAAAMRGMKGSDEAIGAARASVRGLLGPEPPRTPHPLIERDIRLASNREVRDTSRRAFEEIAQRVDSGMEPPKTARAIPRVRLMDRAAADATAQQGKHLVPSPSGGYVGAPKYVKSPRELDVMRQQVDRYAEMGAQWIDPETLETMRGYDWYTRMRQALESMFPGDPNAQADFAITTGIYSEGRAPKGNLQLGLREWNRRALGENQRMVGQPFAGSESQTKRFDKYMRGDFQTEAVGNKTLPYSQQLDPTQNVPMHVSANDQIIGRVYGYEPGPGSNMFDRGLSDSEHAFVDAEQLLAIERANARGLAGKTDWQVGEIQAAEWVGRRAEDLLNQGKVKTLEEGLSQSAEDFRSFFAGERVLLPNESTPGVPGVAPDYANLPFDQRQRQLSSAMRPATAPGWRDEAGGDFMARNLGLAQGGPVQTGLAGFWPTPQGTQMNPMEASAVLAEFVPGENGRQLAPYFREALEEAVTVRAYMDAQAAGSAVAFIPMLKSTSEGVVGNAQNALAVDIGRALTQPEMEQVAQLTNGLGWAVTSHNKGFYLFPTEATSPTGNALGAHFDKVQAAIQQALRGKAAKVTRGRVESVYEMPAWGAEGSGSATGAMQKLFERSSASQYRLEKIDSPELRAKARGQLRFMRKLMDAGHQVRSDYLNALAIVSERGLRGLFEAASKGTIPVPALAWFWSQEEFQKLMGDRLNKDEAEVEPEPSEIEAAPTPDLRRMKGKGTININAEKQMEEALRNQ